MAVLTLAERVDLRNALQGGNQFRPDLTKPELDTAFQQIEDWFEANRASLGAAITGNFTVAQKRHLIIHYLRQKAARGG